MTASVQDNDSVESFEMDIMSEESEDDEEEQLFVKNGKKSYDNGSAKKPLIKGSKKNGRRKRGIHTEQNQMHREPKSQRRRDAENQRAREARSKSNREPNLWTLWLKH